MCRRADRVEAQEGEKDDGRSAQDAGEAELTKLARVLGDVGRVVLHLDVFPAQDDEDQDNRHLQENDDPVEDGAALRAPDEEEAHQDDNDEGRDVDDAAVPGTGGQGMGQMDPEALEEDNEIAAPADADRRGGHAIFQYQVPADDPGDELAHGRVGIGVGTSRHRDH